MLMRRAPVPTTAAVVDVVVVEEDGIAAGGNFDRLQTEGTKKG